MSEKSNRPTVLQAGSTGLNTAQKAIELSLRAVRHASWYISYQLGRHSHD